MQHLITEMQVALQTAAQCLNHTGQDWLVGGSCSLLFQGVEMASPPRDIDLYADRNAVVTLHSAMEQWSCDEQVLNTSGLYSSILSHYMIDNMQVELVGDFKVSSKGSLYSVDVEGSLYPVAPEIECKGVPMRLTPLSHELIFNLLRERADRYEAIASVMKQQREIHVPLLEKLLKDNRLSASHRQQITTLLELPITFR